MVNLEVGLYYWLPRVVMELQHVGRPMAASSPAPPRSSPLPGPPRPPWGGALSSRITTRAGGASQGCLGRAGCNQSSAIVKGIYSSWVWRNALSLKIPEIEYYYGLAVIPAAAFSAPRVRGVSWATGSQVSNSVFRNSLLFHDCKTNT